MSEALNLPASLERLEISPERLECSKVEDNVVLKRGTKNDDPECSLESLSLKSVCPQGNCLCNKKRQTDKEKVLKRIVHKRPILRRSKFSSAVLRAPILKLSPPLDPTKRNVPNSKFLCMPCSTSGNKGPSVLDGNFCKPDKPQTKCMITPTQYSIGDYAYNSLPTVQIRMPLETLNRVPTQTEGQRLPSSASQQNVSCCAVQARIAAEATPTTSDDTTIDELASYFDLFVHIPKKMSVMAEMMYI